MTTITKDSLPADTRLIYATPVSSPVFEITFCQTSIPDDQVSSLASSLFRLLALSPSPPPPAPLPSLSLSTFLSCSLPFFLPFSRRSEEQWTCPQALAHEFAKLAAALLSLASKRGRR